MGRHDNTGRDTCDVIAGSGVPCSRLGRIDGRCWQHIPKVLPPPTLDETGAAVITTASGHAFRIDVEDYTSVAQFSWTLSPQGYPRRWVLMSGRRPRSIEIQRHLLDLGLGDPRVGDHINGDILDNRRCNLRVVDRFMNAQNSRAWKGYRGAIWNASKGNWRAVARVNGKRHYLGNYATEAEAGEAAHQWRLLHMPGYVDRPDARRAS